MTDPDEPRDPFPEPSRRELLVPVTRLDSRGRSGRSALVGGVLVVAALIVAVASGALFPGPGPSPHPTLVAVSSVHPGPDGPTPVTTPGIGPSTPPSTPLSMPALPDMAEQDLVNAVKSGALVGTVVLVDGDLLVTRTSCPALASCPVTLSIAGLDLPIEAAPELVPWDRDPPTGVTLVLDVNGYGLELLGALVPDVAAPVSITTLLSNPGRLLSLPDLYPVDGMFVRGAGAMCASDTGSGPGPAPSPDPGFGVCIAEPFLTDGQSSPYAAILGGSAAPVTMAQRVPGLDPAVSFADWTSGTFLLRRIYRPDCAGIELPAGVHCDQQFVIRPQVVARITVLNAVRVTVTQLAAGTGSIVGTVLDPAGNPLPGMGISVAADAGQAPPSAATFSTDAAGQFKLTGLAPTGWWIEVLQTAANVNPIVIGRVHVQVESGQESSIFITATPGVAIPGPITG